MGAHELLVEGQISTSCLVVSSECEDTHDPQPRNFTAREKKCVHLYQGHMHISSLCSKWPQPGSNPKVASQKNIQLWCFQPNLHHAAIKVNELLMSVAR